MVELCSGEKKQIPMKLMCYSKRAVSRREIVSLSQGFSFYAEWNVSPMIEEWIHLWFLI